MRFKIFLFSAALVACFSSCNDNPKDQATSGSGNPLLEEWQGKFGGVPPFDRIKAEHFKPAFEISMEETLAETDRIAGNTAAPDFENTIAALERSGKRYNRVITLYYIWANNMSDSAFQKVESEMSPRIAAFNDKLYQNSALYNRVKTIYESEAYKNLTPEQQRLTWLYQTYYTHAGAQLDTTTKARLSAINQRLAEVNTKFTQHVLADETNVFLTITDKNDLAGLPQSLIDAAGEEAGNRKVKGWVISNTRSSIDPFLSAADNRALREKAWKMFTSRGDNGDANDNNALISEILQLRAERAALLGFQTHAHFMLDDKMAKTPERAMELMNQVWKPAVARVKSEVADMQAIAGQEGKTITLEPWDYLYYAEKVRKKKYDLDQNELKPYMQLDKLRDGMFWMAGELFGFSFTPVDSIPVFHEDVRVWKVQNKATGKLVGLWYFDPFARPGKVSGAWMNNYRNQQKMDGEVIPIVSNNSNFLKGKPGEPVLISFDDAVTLFHEFGHALHGLSSNVTYPSLQSPNVARDYVEFPSQLMEHWFTTPEVMNKYALHYETGKPVPQELLEKVERSATFNSGYETATYLSSAIVDMKIHLEGLKKIDADVYERETLKALGMPTAIVMRHRLPHFQHIFSDDGYSAGYYSYLWSEVISEDAYNAFIEASGPYDKAVSKKYSDFVLSVGNTIDPAEGYRLFRGRDPQINALMERRGFVKK